MPCDGLHVRTAPPSAPDSTAIGIT
jgi:hypothetical protein